ncbi:MAG: RT0821/Lpp0805 family surface protein [Holosporales bacterium]|jgi:surface antigen
MMRIFCTVMVVALAGCAGQPQPSRTSVNAVKTSTPKDLAGTMLGAFAGTSMGNGLDKADVLYAQRNAQFAFETQASGQVSSWRNPDSGNSGTLTPSRSFKGSEGRTCREFQQTVKVEGNQEKAFGSACREKDGSWRVVK